MATRTIANGGGNWSSNGTWVEGSAPTSADDVVATASSGNVTIDTSGCVCRSADFTSYVGTLTHSSGAVLTIGDGSGGSLTLVSGMTYAPTSTRSIVFASTTTGNTVTTGGKTLGKVTFSGSGGGWTLQDNLTMSGALALTAGTLNTNAKTISCQSFASSGSTARTLTATNSTITCTQATGAPWSITGTNVTLTMTGSTINVTGSTSPSFTGGAYAYENVNITGGGSISLSDKDASYVNLTITGTASVSSVSVSAGTRTVAGVLTLTGSSTSNRLAVSSSSAGTARTFALSTTGSAALTNVAFTDITFTGSNVPVGGAGLSNGGGNTGIDFSGSITDTQVAGGATAGGNTLTANVPIPAHFVRDYFCNESGVALTSHTGELGATWANHGSYGSGVFTVNSTGRVRCSTATACAYASATPSSADYSVIAPFRVLSAAGKPGINARLNTAADTMYGVDWDGATGTVRLYKIVAGVLTSLGTYSLTVTVGQTHWIRLSCVGTAIKVYVDGTERISATDSAISAAGKVGMRADTTSGSTAGIHVAGIFAALDGYAYPQPYLPLDVFLAGGQSNCEGRGDSTTATAVAPGEGYMFTQCAMVPCLDPVQGGNGDTATTGSAWPAFCAAYKDATGRAAVIQMHAGSGYAMAAAADSGNGNWDASGTKYGEAVTNYDTAITDMTADAYLSGLTIRRAGLLWVQGERDAQAIDDATITKATYKAAFQAMLVRFRNAYGATFPCYIFQTGRPLSGDTTGFSQVRAAQEEVAAADAYTWIVYTDAVNFPSLSYMADELHYTQSGYNAMGAAGGTYVGRMSHNTKSGGSMAFKPTLAKSSGSFKQRRVKTKMNGVFV